MPRPLSFDPDQTLTRAMLYFWQKGYQHTSINDLCDHLGLNKYSLYQQYGNKETLFQRSLKQYKDTIYAPLITPLKAEIGMQSIQGYIENLEKGLASTQADFGCLINNTLSHTHQLPESCHHAAIEATKALRYLLKRNFQTAFELGEIRCAPATCLNFTLMTIQALVQTRKTSGLLVMRQNARFFQKQMTYW